MAFSSPIAPQNLAVSFTNRANWPETPSRLTFFVGPSRCQEHPRDDAPCASINDHNSRQIAITFLNHLPVFDGKIYESNTLNLCPHYKEVTQEDIRDIISGHNSRSDKTIYGVVDRYQEFSDQEGNRELIRKSYLSEPLNVSTLLFEIMHTLEESKDCLKDPQIDVKLITYRDSQQKEINSTVGLTHSVALAQV